MTKSLMDCTWNFRDVHYFVFRLTEHWPIVRCQHTQKTCLDIILSLWFIFKVRHKILRTK